jgi:NifU-like protein involved in Fe-S cluster formation
LKRQEKKHPKEVSSLGTLSKRFVRHANSPQCYGGLSHANGRAKGVGSCGDTIEIFLDVNGEKIKRVGHVPEGCAYTIACASAVSTLVKDRVLDDALQVTADDVARELGGLPRDHMHCAALAVNTLGEAIEDYYGKVWGKEKKANQ